MSHVTRHFASRISEDTVRYHTKQLYRKLDIHNRQELMVAVLATREEA